MNISIVGAGRVAQNLAIAVVRSGHRLVSIHNRSAGRAAKVARLVRGMGCIPTVFSMEGDGDGWLQIPEETECSIFCVADDALASVIEKVRPSRDLLCLHTAGSLSMSLWEGRAERYGVLYPLQTFSEIEIGTAVNFNELPLFVEASDEDALEQIEELARSLSERIYHLNSEQRKWLHVSAVFGCNFVNALYGVAEECLGEIGLPLSVLHGLIDETVAKVHRLSPRDAQTGPAQRKDRGVVTAQLELLADKPKLQELYRVMSERIMSEKL